MNREVMVKSGIMGLANKIGINMDEVMEWMEKEVNGNIFLTGVFTLASLVIGLMIVGIILGKMLPSLQSATPTNSPFYNSTNSIVENTASSMDIMSLAPYLVVGGTIMTGLFMYFQFR